MIPKEVLAKLRPEVQTEKTKTETGYSAVEKILFKLAGCEHKVSAGLFCKVSLRGEQALTIWVFQDGSDADQAIQIWNEEEGTLNWMTVLTFTHPSLKRRIILCMADIPDEFVETYGSKLIPLSQGENDAVTDLSGYHTRKQRKLIWDVTWNKDDGALEAELVRWFTTLFSERQPRQKRQS